MIGLARDGDAGWTAGAKLRGRGATLVLAPRPLCRVPSMRLAVPLMLVGAALLAGGARPAAPPIAVAQGDSLSAAADRGRILGSDKATVWMLIVSDFQCPFCKDWHDKTWPALDREYVRTGKVRVAYVNFPLSMHANARPTAVAAMCASVQGKFWPMSDRLFENQKSWKDLKDPQPYLDSVATKIGLNADQMKKCASAKSIGAMIDADQTRMARAGASSTPTFFIGGSKVEGAQPIELFRRVLDAELAAAAKRR